MYWLLSFVFHHLKWRERTFERLWKYFFSATANRSLWGPWNWLRYLFQRRSWSYSILPFGLRKLCLAATRANPHPKYSAIYGLWTPNQELREENTDFLENKALKDHPKYTNLPKKQSGNYSEHRCCIHEYYYLAPKTIIYVTRLTENTAKFIAHGCINVTWVQWGVKSRFYFEKTTTIYRIFLLRVYILSCISHNDFKYKNDYILTSP